MMMMIIIIIIIIIKTLFKMRVTLNSKANKPVALPKITLEYYKNTMMMIACKRICFVSAHVSFAKKTRAKNGCSRSQACKASDDLILS